jgi:hypothetical protein
VYDCVGIGYGVTATSGDFPIYLPVQMRTQPAVTSSGAFTVADGAGGGGSASAINISTNQATTTNGFINVTCSGLTAGRAYKLIANNTTSASLIYSAEL